MTATLGAIEPGSLEVEWNTLTDEAVLGTYTQNQLMEMGVSVLVVGSMLGAVFLGATWF